VIRSRISSKFGDKVLRAQLVQGSDDCDRLISPENGLRVAMAHQ
jgi:hypothetical protein